MPAELAADRRRYRGVSIVARSDEVRVEAGAIAFVHRGGGSLNLDTHLQVIAAEGVGRCASDGTHEATVRRSRASACAWRGEDVLTPSGACRRRARARGARG